jgi:hypothetical protein
VSGRPARAALSLLTAGTVLGACGGTPATVGHQLQSWATGAGWPASARTLHGDLARLSDVGSDGPGARRTVCDVLVTDALSANEQLPTPDGELTSLLSRGYAPAAAAGRACFADAAGLPGAIVEGRRAASYLVRAQARYDALTSTLPSS